MKRLLLLCVSAYLCISCRTLHTGYDYSVDPDAQALIFDYPVTLIIKGIFQSSEPEICQAGEGCTPLEMYIKEELPTQQNLYRPMGLVHEPLVLRYLALRLRPDSLDGDVFVDEIGVLHEALPSGYQTMALGIPEGIGTIEDTDEGCKFTFQPAMGTRAPESHVFPSNCDGVYSHRWEWRSNERWTHFTSVGAIICSRISGTGMMRIAPDCRKFVSTQEDISS